MREEKFKVIFTGKINVSMGIEKIANRLAIKFNIDPEKALKIITAKKEVIINKKLDHVKAYKLKSAMEEIGMQARLERFLLFTEKKTEQSKETDEEAKSETKIKNQPKAVKIKWDEKPRTYVTIQTKPTNISYTNVLIIIIFACGFWYLYNSKFSFGSADAFDEEGNPIVILFTISQCGKICNDVVRDLNFRQVPFKHLNINPNNAEDEDVKLWRSYGKAFFPLTVSGNEILGGNSKPSMSTLLALNFGNKYLSTTENFFYRNHFNEDGTDAIVIYGAQWCKYCKRLKEQLKNEGIPFRYIDVDRVGNKNLLAKTLDIHGYPAVWVGYTRSKKVKFSDVKSAYNKI